MRREKMLNLTCNAMPQCDLDVQFVDDNVVVVLTENAWVWKEKDKSVAVEEDTLQNVQVAAFMLQDWCCCCTKSRVIENVQQWEEAIMVGTCSSSLYCCWKCRFCCTFENTCRLFYLFLFVQTLWKDDEWIFLSVNLMHLK